jgi:hypothetical protein
VIVTLKDEKMLYGQYIKENWTLIKSQILKKWNKLNEADVDFTQGDSRKLKTLVQNQYGLSERFDSEFARILHLATSNHSPASQVNNRTGSKLGEPYKSPNMTNGWKKGQGMNVGSSSEKEKENTAGENPGTDSAQGYQGLDSNTEQSDINPAGQTNIKDFMHATDPIISDRSYSEAPDEFSPNQDPSLSATDVPLGGSHSSATNSSANNAVFNSFEDHSRSTKKL